MGTEECQVLTEWCRKRGGDAKVVEIETCAVEFERLGYVPRGQRVRAYVDGKYIPKVESTNLWLYFPFNLKPGSMVCFLPGESLGVHYHECVGRDQRSA